MKILQKSNKNNIMGRFMHIFIKLNKLKNKQYYYTI